MFRSGPFPPSTLEIGATERARLGNRALSNVFPEKPKLKMVEPGTSLAPALEDVPLACDAIAEKQTARLLPRSVSPQDTQTRGGRPARP